MIVVIAVTKAGIRILAAIAMVVIVTIVMFVAVGAHRALLVREVRKA